MLKHQAGNILTGILVLLAVVAAAALGYWYFYPQERPWWVKEYLPSLPAVSAKIEMYKWRDEQGHWQYSNTPPAEGVSYEIIEYWENSNVIPSGLKEQDN